MLQKVAFSMYNVNDAFRARAFYEDTLGLTRGSASSDGTWTEYDLPGGGCLALFRHPNGEPQATGTGGSVALEVENLDAFNAQLKAAGVEYKADMIHSPVCRMSVIRDSEGNEIILHELKTKPPAAKAKAKTSTKKPAKTKPGKPATNKKSRR
jgi:predicted enzyme related to lactoylglutathione lyase